MMAPKKQACPECRKNGKDRTGDNLHVYPDHVYCFSCGFYKKSRGGWYRTTKQTGVSGESQLVSSSRNGHNTKSLALPSDFTCPPDTPAYKWLENHELDLATIMKHRIGWSKNGFTMMGHGANQTPIQYAPCMVVPIYDSQGTLLMYQARYFGNQSGLPKWVTKGNKNDVLHVLGTGDGPIAVVEDIISAIKISQYCRAVPLFGANFSKNMALRLAMLTDTLYVWLDHDMRKKSHGLAMLTDTLYVWLDHDMRKKSHTYVQQYSTMFKKIRAVPAAVDPKKVYNSSLNYLFGHLKHET